MVLYQTTMGLLDGIFKQLEIFRGVKNTNPENIRARAVGAYSGDDDSGSDSDSSVSSEDLEAELAFGGNASAPPVEGFFTEEELGVFKEKVDAFDAVSFGDVDEVEYASKKAELEPYITKASRIFARYGGVEFVKNTFFNELRQGTSNHKQQALGKEALQVPTAPSRDARDSSAESGSLPSNWSGGGTTGAMTKWQKYAWIQWREIKSASVLKQILGDLWDERATPVELADVAKRMFAPRATEWQSLVETTRVLENGRAKGDLVSKFRPGMIWSHQSDEFRLVSMFHDPAKPREVMFVHTKKGAPSAAPTIWTGTLDKHITVPPTQSQQEYGSERITFDPYTSYSPERPFPVGFETSLYEPYPYVFASDPGFQSQLRFNIGDRYFCPARGEDDIASFEMYTVIEIKENQYVVFKRDGDGAKATGLIQISDNEGSDVTLIPGSHLLKIEYTQIDDTGDDTGDYIYATYTPNVKTDLEEMQIYEQEAGDQREATMARNANVRGSDTESEDDSTSGAGFALAFADEQHLANNSTGGDSDLNDLGVVRSGHLQRKAYYDNRSSRSTKRLSRFRVGQTLAGKGRKGAKARMTITKRGTKADSANEYIDVNVTGASGLHLGKYQYKIKMDPKGGYPFYRTNAAYAFEVANLVGDANSHCPKRISAWMQACPLGYERGVGYFTDNQGGILFEVGARLSSGNVHISAQEWVDETKRDNPKFPLPFSGGDGGLEIYENSDSEGKLRWEELLVPDPQRIYAEEPPICREEYRATIAARAKIAARAQRAVAAPTASKGRFTTDEFKEYKRLLQNEEQYNSDDSEDESGNSAALHQFRARAAKLLGGKFNVQLILEPNFNGEFEDDESLNDYLGILNDLLDGDAFEAEWLKLGINASDASSSDGEWQGVPQNST